MTRSTLAIAVLAGALAAACAVVAGVEDVNYGPSAPSPGDASTPGDASIPGDASKPPSDASTDANDCDRDRDGVPNRACGGPDCDDDDPRVHPDAGFVDVPPPPGKTGDWNCDGVVTKQFSTELTCVGLPVDDCAARGAFARDTACGATGDLIRCSSVGASCVPMASTPATQACR